MALQLIGPPERPAGAAPPPTTLPAPPRTAEGTRLLLVRHAEVAHEYSAIAYGAMDVALSPAGSEATRQLGAAFAGFPVTRVISSDLARALEMGRGIAASTGAALTSTAALREVDRGAWQGIAREQFIANWAADTDTYWRDPWNWKTHGGDSDADLWARGGAALQEGLLAVEGGTLVVTAHTNLIRVLLGVLLRVPTPLNYRFETGPAHLHVLAIEAGTWKHVARDLDRPPSD